MSFVFLTKGANLDLQESHSYLQDNDPAQRDYVLGKIKELIQSLSSNPYRCSYPEELLELGIKEFREVYFKPYRIIYKVAPEGVFVVVIADGRRNFASLLQKRMFS